MKYINTEKGDLEMLVTLKDVLRVAEAKKCAIGSFNTPNLASMRAVISADSFSVKVY